MSADGAQSVCRFCRKENYEQSHMSQYYSIPVHSQCSLSLSKVSSAVAEAIANFASRGMRLNVDFEKAFNKVDRQLSISMKDFMEARGNEELIILFKQTAPYQQWNRELNYERQHREAWGPVI